MSAESAGGLTEPSAASAGGRADPSALSAGGREDPGAASAAGQTDRSTASADGKADPSAAKGPSGSKEPRRPTEAEVLARIESARARRPKLADQSVTLAHGAGGKASAALIESVFLAAFGRPGKELTDAALLSVADGRLAFSTDSYVVNPLRFPGGSVGDLAVNGTANDLAVSGAIPRWISAAFVIEEGFPVAELRAIAQDMRAAADKAGVAIVTGDTKVVPRGAADAVFITTAGIGLVPRGRQLGAEKVQVGDRILISGSIADHGMAVMMARGHLAIDAAIRTDSRAVTDLVEALLAAVPDTRWMRDPTRGGLGTLANELAKAAAVGVELDDSAIPVLPLVRGACDMLGIDPLYVANEGCFVAVVPAAAAETALTAVRAAGAGQAALIGSVVGEPAGRVVVRNAFGGARLVDMLVGDPLPRIC
ncbi:MAG: hydrogenase expression/formation protein HypE [Bifidobacteriaceae bacterium]|jgi:hydrogenase expression/formation protein HypE|nr:hydrogenase expression/formation protein HypE [Bifidobacteriaceae bacterium]